jgi:hypothetical protein
MRKAYQTDLSDDRWSCLETHLLRLPFGRAIGYGREDGLGRGFAGVRPRTRSAQVEAEFRGLRLRQEGQLGRLLGEPLAGESAAALERLAGEDQRQALCGLVALMSNGRTAYKRVEELREGDVPARTAADRLCTTWLKERRDGWLARSPGA